MSLTVAVINYNTRDHLRRCLSSLPRRLRGEPLPTLVVDNASPDGSARMVATEFGTRVKLVANSSNVGFARAVNQALEQTTTPYVMILNADTEHTDGAIEALLEYMEQNPRVGVAGARLEDPDGVLQHSCRAFYDLTTIVLRRTPLGRLMPNHPALRRHLMLDWDHAAPGPVDWMQGACLVLRREALEQVGSMDERFFLYFEDVDLCRRMAGEGWGVHYVPAATFVHHYRRGSHGGGPLSREKVHHLASGLKYLAKWHPGARRALGLVRWLAPLVLLGVDLALINFGFLLCLWLQDALDEPLRALPDDLSSHRQVLGGANGMLVAAFAAHGHYRIERSKDWLATMTATVKSVTWVALLGLAVLFLAPGHRDGFLRARLPLLLYYAFLVLAVGGFRLALKLTLRGLWRRRLLLRRAVLVGEREPTRRLADCLRGDPACGYLVAGQLPFPRAGAGQDDDPGADVMPDFERMLAREQPEAVVFVAHHRSFRNYVPKVLYCFDHSLEVRVATGPHIFPYLHQRVGQICGSPAADVTRSPLYPIKRAIKRLIDVGVAALGLVLMAPLLALLAALIRLEDGGPVLFMQTRVGKRGRRFTIYKLRSMREDISVDERANIAEGPLTLIPNDPRVTRVGRWLRRHKLDELPQLLNVFLGHMSLVGPRPPTATEVAQYTHWQRGRLFVRPGLTGLWQIDKQRKWRFNEMVELDLQYILNWGVLLDLAIMLRTVPAVVRGS